MTNLEAARQDARNGAELGDLRRNLNNAAQEGEYARFCAAKEDCQQRWKAALLAGDEAGAEAVRAEAVVLCNKYYRVQE